jgi:hypothetical protein
LHRKSNNSIKCSNAKRAEQCGNEKVEDVEKLNDSKCVWVSTEETEQKCQEVQTVKPKGIMVLYMGVF